MKDTVFPSPIHRYLEQLHEEFAKNHEGAVADYIPELATADPDWFGRDTQSAIRRGAVFALRATLEQAVHSVIVGSLVIARLQGLVAGVNAARRVRRGRAIEPSSSSSPSSATCRTRLSGAGVTTVHPSPSR